MPLNLLGLSKFTDILKQTLSKTHINCYRYCRLNREESVDGITTNSQILLCYDVSKTEESFQFQIIDLQTVLVYISAAFVILTMLVYSVLPNLLDLQGKCTMHYLAGLAGSYILLGTINLYGDKMNDDLCKTLPYLMYFSFFYMFFWLTTLSFHIWRITVYVSNNSVSICT